MAKAHSIIFPAALLGSLFVIWVGTVAARTMPAGLPLTSYSQPAVSSPSEGQAGGNPPSAQPSGDQGSSQGCSLGPRYPNSVRQWCDLIERYAAESGLDAGLVAAVMLQESGGNPDAYSKSGAVGLLQVMPRDGLAADFQCPNGPCFASRPTIDELKDPEFNLRFGTRMLAGLLKKYGSLQDALKFYGPANVGYTYADKVLAIYTAYQ